MKQDIWNKITRACCITVSVTFHCIKDVPSPMKKKKKSQTRVCTWKTYYFEKFLNVFLMCEGVQCINNKVDKKRPIFLVSIWECTFRKDTSVSITKADYWGLFSWVLKYKIWPETLTRGGRATPYKVFFSVFNRYSISLNGCFTSRQRWLVCIITDHMCCCAITNRYTSLLSCNR